MLWLVCNWHSLHVLVIESFLWDHFKFWNTGSTRLTGLTAHQIGTTVQWNSNTTPLLIIINDLNPSKHSPRVLLLFRKVPSAMLVFIFFLSVILLVWSRNWEYCGLRINDSLWFRPAFRIIVWVNIKRANLLYFNLWNIKSIQNLISFLVFLCESRSLRTKFNPTFYLLITLYGVSKKYPLLFLACLKWC